MKKLLSLALALLVLVGCGSSSPKTSSTPTLVCTGNSQGVDVNNELYADKDVITKIVYNASTEFASLGLDEDTVKLIADGVAENYNLPYIEYSYEIKDGTLTEKTVIDFTKADFKKLYDLGIIDTAEASYISLDLVKEMYTKDLGLSCK